MREMKMDLWDAPAGAWIGIPTNGTVKANGRLVMGAGVANVARERYADLDLVLGSLVKNCGNKVYVFPPGLDGLRLFSFPTKHDWRSDASLELIRKSAAELAKVAKAPDVLAYLPRPGCGLGGLKWEDVRPAIADLLPDNVIVVHTQATDRLRERSNRGAEAKAGLP